MNTQTLDPKEFGGNRLTDKQLAWITENNYWNLWIPKEAGGLECSITEGVGILKQLAKTDGSLGWTTTLCSGANFFMGNLEPLVVSEILSDTPSPVLGGSGAASGSAEEKGDYYEISGTWKYATGAPYLTHFTLNAKVTKNSEPVGNSSGVQQVLSFILPAARVAIIDDWNTMGLKATATCSFRINQLKLHKKYAFRYDHYHMSQPIFRIPFTTFADLTLWANYVGMGEHYAALTSFLPENKTAQLKGLLASANKIMNDYASTVEKITSNHETIPEREMTNFHQKAAALLPQLSRCIIEIHPQCGMRAIRTDDLLSLVFRDFFTATQHHNFR